MTVFKGRCLNCHHYFYWVKVDCQSDDERVYCPLCYGGTELVEIDLPAGKKWAECVHHQCQGCKKNDPKDHE